MNEENKFGPKKRWTRIFRKKWFFPSVYLILAALLISAVMWYQNSGEEQAVVEEWQEQSDNFTPIPTDDTATPVMEQQETIQFPVANRDSAEIVTKFFDYNADESEKVNALIHYNNRYYQSTGLDIVAADGETFEVVAALSGQVVEVKEDPLMGNVVVIEHNDDVKTYYSSLGDVIVEKDAQVLQGDTIGAAGKSNFGKENGNHVHFEIRYGDKAINPESLFNQPLASIEGLVEPAEEEQEDSDAEETEDAEERDEEEQEVEQDEETIEDEIEE